MFGSATLQSNKLRLFGVPHSSRSHALRGAPASTGRACDRSEGSEAFLSNVTCNVEHIFYNQKPSLGPPLWRTGSVGSLKIKILRVA